MKNTDSAVTSKTTRQTKSSATAEIARDADDVTVCACAATSNL